MGLNREDKATVIAEISEVVSNSSAMVIAEYRGLTVQAVTKLRAEARKNGVTVRVVKNTLVRRAVEGTGFAGLADQFTGPLVYGFSRRTPCQVDGYDERAYREARPFPQRSPGALRAYRGRCARCQGTGRCLIPQFLNQFNTT